MPRFELDGVGSEATGSGRVDGLVRGLDLPDAVRRALALPGWAEVAVGPPAGAGAWQDIRIAGAPAGRGRAHQRMRFRRD